MAESLRVDELDRNIIDHLVSDGRASFAEIGQRVALSAPAVKRRVDRLVRDGVITGFTVELSPQFSGGLVSAFVEVYCRPATSPAQIRSALRQLPSVRYGATLTGDVDFLVQISAESQQDLDAAVESVAALSFVERTKTSVVLSVLQDRA